MGERKAKSGDGVRPNTEPEQDDAQRAFDLWLRRGLHRLYDEVAIQPIPDNLLRLIEEDRRSKALGKAGSEMEG